MKKRSVQWSPSSFTVPTVEARRGERDGHAPNGKQKYRCHACGRRSRETPTPNAYPEARREEILHTSQERSSLRGLTRTFGVSRTTVRVGSKKRSSASSFTYTPARPGSRGSHFHHAGIGRTDGSFVLKKARQVWVWIALCPKSRQVVASALGDRSKRTCQRRWESIPDSYRAGHCFTDFWAASRVVIALRTTYGSRQRDRRNGPCGAVE